MYARPDASQSKNVPANGHAVDLTEPLMNHARASMIYFLVATSDVAAGRHERVKQLQSLGKFDAMRACEWGMELACYIRIRSRDLPNQQPRRGRL
jgi:hypothetical protein